MNKKFNLSADVFVIPNRACRVSGFGIFTEKRTAEMTTMCESSGSTFDPKSDKLVQVWICSDECDNYQDHYPRVIIDGKRYNYRLPGYIPYSLLKDIKENESFKLSMPVDLISYDDDNTIPAIVDITLTAKQGEYRYRRFGNFEEVVHDVVA